MRKCVFEAAFYNGELLPVSGFCRTDHLRKTFFDVRQVIVTYAQTDVSLVFGEGP